MDRPLLADVAQTDALTYAVGLQVGHRMELGSLGDSWSVTPRVSITYIDSAINSFTDATGLIVDFTDSDSMLLEVGMISGLDFDLQGNRVLSLSAELGVEREVGGTMSFTGNSTDFSAERNNTNVKLGGGTSLQLGDDFSLFARSEMTTPFSGGAHTLQGSAGLRITF